MEGLTMDQVTTTLIVIVILAGAYTTIINAIKAHREEKKLRDGPLNQLAAKVNKHEELLAKDKERLDKIDERMENSEHMSVIILRSVRSLLSHEVNGNSTDKLKDSMNEIDDYLIRR